MNTRLDQLQNDITQHFCWNESDCVRHLLAQSKLSHEQRQQIQTRATGLIRFAREHKHQRDQLDAFLDEFSLNSTEGTVLMCLAEALLRIPDIDTADDLIHEKLTQGDWKKHVLKSDSLLVNASTWGLLLTGKWLNFEDTLRKNQHHWIANFIERLGEPAFRHALTRAMRIMARQYILGTNIKDSIARGKKDYSPTTLFSFDALGEGARTIEDADRHLIAYRDLIEHLSDLDNSSNTTNFHSISIKLSAIHPRYQTTQKQRVMEELLPLVLDLCYEARNANIGVSIDAEEAERLDISLDLFRQIALDPILKQWEGLGFVLQAYQKRAVLVAEWLGELAKQRPAPFNVRLVKGAYWDREIKRSQQLGLADYPVFTRKTNTDLSYLACAQRLFDFGNPCIYPQFATHNACSLAIIETISNGQKYELQRLHGMGDLIYLGIEKTSTTPLPIRIYAPIGDHNDLLPYLVRRLLENGANSSFVNRFLDEKVALEQLAMDPLTLMDQTGHLRNPKIPLPIQLYPDRPNSTGLDIENTSQLQPILDAINEFEKQIPFLLTSLTGENSKEQQRPGADRCAINNPAFDDKVLGIYHEATKEEIESALSVASQHQKQWDNVGGNARADILSRVAEHLENNKPDLIATIVSEAGRTIADAETEIREGIDFCHYYALQARLKFGAPKALSGPTGETNHISLHGRGTFLCISPWNFPAAIFIGQIAAALVAGNAVIAKPAEQTNITAVKIMKLMLAAGVPKEILHLVLGNGARLGELMLSDERINGVVFTGSTTASHSINTRLANRPGSITPLIAETGGINCMIVDSSALAEQVVDDVIKSAFFSAGQRCSALRVLYLQEEVADNLIDFIANTCEQLCVGDPAQTSTDIGPIIDKNAFDRIQDYLNQPHIRDRCLYRYCNLPKTGFFIGPHIIQVDSLEQVEQEIFGPVLHVIRFQRKDIEKVIDDIDRCPYALTLGIHSRVERFAENIFSKTNIGNTYINRNMVGAVVGVQPFGGRKLSGTGPKAGGPDYITRFAIEKTKTVNTVATGGNTDLFNLGE